ncbi:LuxR C-terminal-related transcriptional regulator [Xanthobacter sediminis]
METGGSLSGPLIEASAPQQQRSAKTDIDLQVSRPKQLERPRPGRFGNGRRRPLGSAVFRSLDDARFGPAEKAVVEHALRGLLWFHRRQMLGEGRSIASAPLEPRVLHGLLHGPTAKNIATALGQSDQTTREYVKRLLRKYGVGSRSELMALWLGKRVSL